MQRFQKKLKIFYGKLSGHPWWFGYGGFLVIGLIYRMPWLQATSLACLAITGSAIVWRQYIRRSPHVLAGLQTVALVAGQQQYAQAQLTVPDTVCSGFNVIPGFGDAMIGGLGWLNVQGFSLAGAVCGIGWLILAGVVLGAIGFAGKNSLGHSHHGGDVQEMSRPVVGLLYFTIVMIMIGALIFSATR